MDFETIQKFADMIDTIGLVGVLALLAFPKTREWLGFSGSGKGSEVDTEQNEILEKHTLEISALEKHAQVANHEMGEVKKDVAEIKTDIKMLTGDVSEVKETLAFIRGKLEKS